MNAWQILGGIVSLLGTILMFYGAYQQAQGDKKFQESVGSFVSKNVAEDAPELVLLTMEPKDTDYFITVRNIGRKPAAKVKVIFSEQSIPSVFSSNLISGAREIPQNTEFTLPLNLFTGLNRAINLPNSSSVYKEELKSSLHKFNAGEMAFIPRFYIEYYHGAKRITTSTYYLVLQKRGGLIHIGKDE